MLFIHFISREARSRAILASNLTKDPSYMYGNSASNLGAHWKARRDMINSTMNRNSSLIRFDNKQREQGFLDLARKTKSNNHIFYTFALRRMRIFSIVN